MLPLESRELCLDVRRYLPQPHRDKEDGHFAWRRRVLGAAERIQVSQVWACSLNLFVGCFDGESGLYIAVIDQEWSVQRCRAVSVNQVELPENSSPSLLFQEVKVVSRVGMEPKLNAKTSTKPNNVPDRGS